MIAVVNPHESDASSSTEYVTPPPLASQANEHYTVLKDHWLNLQSGSIWPMPQKLHYGAQNRTVRKGAVLMQFRGGQRDVDCDILEHAKNTYRMWIG